MTIVAITQRVYTDAAHGEKRDCLDQSWINFLNEVGITPIIIPNNIVSAKILVSQIKIGGIVFTGGGTLYAYGGKTPERDETEEFLLNYSKTNTIPLIGVCRGMQTIQHDHGVKLQEITGHVADIQQVTINGREESVNSYHNFGTSDTVPELKVWAKSLDGVVKAIKHTVHPITGIMWHPERLTPFVQRDIDLFRKIFLPKKK